MKLGLNVEGGVLVCTPWFEHEIYSSVNKFTCRALL